MEPGEEISRAANASSIAARRAICADVNTNPEVFLLDRKGSLIFIVDRVVVDGCDAWRCRLVSENIRMVEMSSQLMHSIVGTSDDDLAV